MPTSLPAHLCHFIPTPHHLSPDSPLHLPLPSYKSKTTEVRLKFLKHRSGRATPLSKSSVASHSPQNIIHVLPVVTSPYKTPPLSPHLPSPSPPPIFSATGILLLFLKGAPKLTPFLVASQPFAWNVLSLGLCMADPSRQMLAQLFLFNGTFNEHSIKIPPSPILSPFPSDDPTWCPTSIIFFPQSGLFIYSLVYYVS